MQWTRIRSLAVLSFRPRHPKLPPSLTPTSPTSHSHATVYPTSFLRRTHSSFPVASSKEPKVDDAFWEGRDKQMEEIYNYKLVHELVETHFEARIAVTDLERRVLERFGAIDPDTTDPREFALSLMRDPELQVAGTRAVEAFRDAEIAYDLTGVIKLAKDWGGITDEEINEPVLDEIAMEAEGDGGEKGDGGGVSPKV